MKMATSLLVTLVVAQVKCLAAASTQDTSKPPDNPICKVMWHFQSPYVTPLLEKVSQVTGCGSKEITAKSEEIHILSLSNSGGDGSLGVESGYLPSVSLHVRPQLRHSFHSGPIVIILHSANPVMWQLHAKHMMNTSSFLMIVNKPSQLVSSTSVAVLRKRLPALNTLLTWARNHYGAVTSFSHVPVANKIALLVGTNMHSSNEYCNTSSSAISNNVDAVLVQPQPLAGCIGEDNENSDNRTTVTHVVEVESSTEDNDIVVHLQPQGIRQLLDVPVVKQNLVLVLKCHQTIKWMIESWGVQGTLDIVAEYPVHIQMSSSYQNLKVQNMDLPTDTDALLVMSEENFGPVFTFTKATKANRINVIVKGKKVEPEHFSIQSDSNYSHFPLQKNTLKVPPSLTSSTPSIKLHDKHQDADLAAAVQNGKAYSMVRSRHNEAKMGKKNPLQALLAQEMTLECYENNVKIIFPFDKVTQVLTSVLGMDGEVSSIALNDLSCKAVVNNSHIVLQSPWNGCGSKIISVENGEIYYNQVQFLTKHYKGEDEAKRQSSLPTDDEDMSESGSGLYEGADESKYEDSKSLQIVYPYPFHCNRNFSSSQKNMNSNFEMSESGIFEMNLYLDKNFNEAIPSNAFPLRIAAHDHIFAEAVIETDPRLCLVTEECWLSASDDSIQETSKKNVLIKKGCPSDLSVEMFSQGSCKDQHPTSSRHWQRFSFQLSEDFVNEYIYLHCRLSICAIIDSKGMKIKQCMNTEDFCVNHSLRPFLDSPASKKFGLEVRGPLHILSKRHGGNNKGFVFFGKAPDGFSKKITPVAKDESQKKTPVTQVILIGLTTEAVVGIAFASFVIGAGLMAMLWLIHLRTDPTRRERTPPRQMTQSHHPNSHGHHSGYDLSGHSGSSTPSSQAPMTVHACT